MKKEKLWYTQPKISQFSVNSPFCQNLTISTMKSRLNF